MPYVASEPFDQFSPSAALWMDVRGGFTIT